MQIPRRKPGKYAGLEPDHYLSAEKLARLKAELIDLESAQLLPAADEVRRTSEMGDRSENAAYTEARARLNRIHSRIMSLKERIRQAIVIESGPDPSGRVRIGSTVVVEVNGQRKEYEILGSQETSPARGRISHVSPLGAVLLGHRIDETVTVTANSKNVEYRIIDIR